MGLTQRFGFTWFGGREGGSITDDGSKFTLDDRQATDRILNAFESHTHDRADGGTRVVDPVAAPTAVAAETGGALPGGRTYFYSVGFLDEYGLETAGSAEVTVSTAAPIETPGPPQGQTVPTGTLTPGMYYYAVTALTATGEETTLSTAALVTVLVGDGGVELAMPAKAAGVAQFRVWRQRAGEAGFTKIGVTATDTFTDDGAVPSDPCACDPGNLPPRRNQTTSTNSITVTLAGADAAVVTDPATRVTAWRLYRTEVSGAYATEALVHEVVERVDPVDPLTALLTSWTDVGGQLLTGRPKPLSQTLVVPQIHQVPEVAALPDPAVYPMRSPVSFLGVVYLSDGVVWRAQVPSYGAAEVLPDPTLVSEGFTVLKAGKVWVVEAGAWVQQSPLPAGGTEGQVLTRDVGGVAVWSDPASTFDELLAYGFMSDWSTSLPFLTIGGDLGGGRRSVSLMAYTEFTDLSFYFSGVPDLVPPLDLSRANGQVGYAGIMAGRTFVTLDVSGCAAADVFQLVSPDGATLDYVLSAAEVTAGSLDLSTDGQKRVTLPTSLVQPLIIGPSTAKLTYCEWSYYFVVQGEIASNWERIPVRESMVSLVGADATVTWNTSTVTYPSLPTDYTIECFVVGGALQATQTLARSVGTATFLALPVGKYQFVAQSAAGTGGPYLPRQLLGIVEVV